MDEQNEVFATQEKFAEEYGGALKQLESSVGKLAMIDHKSLTEMTLVKQPPKVLKDLISAICMIFGMLKPSWEEATAFICNRDIRNILLQFEPKNVELNARTNVTKFYHLNLNSFDPNREEKINKSAITLAEQVEGVVDIFEIFTKFERIPDGKKILEKIEKAL